MVIISSAAAEKEICSIILLNILHNRMEREIDALRSTRGELKWAETRWAKRNYWDSELWSCARTRPLSDGMYKLQDKLNNDDDNYWRLEDRQEDERKLIAMAMTLRWARGGDPLTVEPDRFFKNCSIDHQQMTSSRRLLLLIVVIFHADTTQMYR